MHTYTYLHCLRLTGLFSHCGLMSPANCVGEWSPVDCGCWDSVWGVFWKVSTPFSLIKCWCVDMTLPSLLSGDESFKGWRPGSRYRPWNDWLSGIVNTCMIASRAALSTALSSCRAESDSCASSSLFVRLFLSLSWRWGGRWGGRVGGSKQRSVDRNDDWTT